MIPTMGPEQWSSEQGDRVAALYSGGARLDDIVTETGVPRATIYWMLRQRGLRPSRQTPSRGLPADPSDMQEWAERLMRIEGIAEAILAKVEALEEGGLTASDDTPSLE
jgi:hypothetical protein